MMDNMQTTESNRIDRNAFLSWFSIMNSIPLVAKKTGEVTAAAISIPVDSFSFPVAIMVSPEATKNDNVIRSPKFIRLIRYFIGSSVSKLNYKLIFCWKPETG